MKKQATKMFGLLLSIALMVSYVPIAFAQTVAQAVSADTPIISAIITATDTNDSGRAGGTGLTATDNQPPALASVTPVSGTDVQTASIIVQANGISDPSGVKSVSFIVYNQADGLKKAVSYTAENSGDGVWFKDIDLRSLGNKPGNYAVKVWALDNNDNAGMIGSSNINYAGTAISGRDKIETFINTAEAQLTKRYVRGGKGPDVFDCSGLVYYALQSSENGVSYMTSRLWASSSYPRVNSMSDLQRGDVVCFRGHVGIYLGDGAMIDASSSQGKVRITHNIQSSSYWKRNFICGRRPL